MKYWLLVNVDKNTIGMECII